MAETTPRTTTRKPRTRAAVSGETSAAATPVRRLSPRKKTAAATPTSVTATPARKAPTTVSREVVRRRPVLLYVGIGMFVLLIAVSAIIGVNADGQINVAGTIMAQGGGQYVSPDGTPMQMPSQGTNVQPINSGLVPSTGQSTAVTPPPPVETASSTDTASTTDNAASSTDAALTGEEATPAGEVAGEASTAEEVTPETPAQ